MRTAEEIMDELLYLREIARVVREQTDHLEKLNETLPLCLTQPHKILTAQDELIEIIKLNSVVSDLLIGRGNQLEKEIENV